MVDNKMTLTYFDLYGRAEACRMILNYGKIDFNDNRINKETFAQMKADGKCGPGG